MATLTPPPLHPRGVSTVSTYFGADTEISQKDQDQESEARQQQDSDYEKLHKRKAIVWYIFSFLLCIVFIMVGAYLGWTLRVHDFSTSTTPDLSYTGRTISLEADLISVDPVAGVMIIDWYILSDSTCQSPGSTSSSDCSAVGIYFESNPLQLSGSVDSSGAPIIPTNAPPSLLNPVFNYFPNITVDARASIAAWRTSISMIDRHSSVPRANGYSLSTSLQSYPYDVYSANVTFFATETANVDVPVRLEVAASEGVAVGFKVQAFSNRVNSTGGETLQISLQVSRGVLVKTYAIIIVAAVWVITLIFVCSTAGSLVFGIPQKSELLVVPVATLFAVTQLRGSMPGAPNGFGAIVDYVGLLPCLAIMSACAALSVGVLVFAQEPEKHRPTILDKILVRPSHAKHESEQHESHA